MTYLYFLRDAYLDFLFFQEREQQSSFILSILVWMMVQAHTGPHSINMHRHTYKAIDITLTPCGLSYRHSKPKCTYTQMAIHPVELSSIQSMWCVCAKTLTSAPEDSHVAESFSTCLSSGKRQYPSSCCHGYIQNRFPPPTTQMI